VDVSGKPVEGVKVYVVAPGGPGMRSGRTPDAISDRAGTFTLRGLDPADNVSLRARTDRAATDGAVVVSPKQEKGLRLVVSEGNTFRVRGVVTDEDGRPIRDAAVVLWWVRSYASKRLSVGSGLGSILQEFRTGADGKFESAVLWPGDHYHVEAMAEGHAKAETARVTGRTGQVHDLGRIILARATGAVRGRVVDSAERPVAGARVFNAGDAPQPISLRTDAQGQFHLQGLYAGPVYVFTEKAGYRFAGVRALPNSSEVTVKLFTTKERPPDAKSPPGGPPLAEQHRVARQLLERLWDLPAERKSQSTRSLVEGMTRLDPARGLRWAEQAGGRNLQTARVTAAEILARTDPDETLALLGQVGGYSGFRVLHALGERYGKSDPARALRFTEEAVVRARALDQPNRALALASVGNLVRQLGRDEAGRKLIDEAAAAAANLGKGGLQELARAQAAEALAPYDLPRALALLEPIRERQARERYLGNVAVALCPDDLGKALQIIEQFERLSTLPGLVRMRLAYRLAPSRPAEAIRVVEGMTGYGANEMKAEALAWVAVAVADKKLAWSLIDRSMAALRDAASAGRRRSDRYSVTAARVVGQAREVGYPDLESLVYQVLSLRPTTQDDSPARVAEALVDTALVLALADPATAKQILQGVEARGGPVGAGTGSFRKGHWLMAWALADPAHAAALFDGELAALRANPKARLEHSGLVELAEILTVPPPDRARHLHRYIGGFWFPGEE
jgi:hypothetical protein